MDLVKKTTLSLLGCCVIIFCYPGNAVGNAPSDNSSFNGSFTDSLDNLLDNLDGQAGMYLYHFDQEKSYAYNADTVFTSASMVKLPILITIYDKIEAGKFDRSDEFAFKEEYKPASFPHMVGNLHPGSEVPLSELIMMMISFSDNTASLWLQALAGGGENINQVMLDLDLCHTYVNSRTEGREAEFEQYGWGQTTPREMTSLMKQLYQRELISPLASESMYRVLSRSYYESEALSQMPAEINVASKQGAVSHSRSETVVVNAPSGSYAFTIITQNQSDTSWDVDNDGYELIRNISRTLFEEFEPEYDYNPPTQEQIERWY